MSRQTVIKINWPRDVTETVNKNSFFLVCLVPFVQLHADVVGWSISTFIATSSLQEYSVHHVAVYHVVLPDHIHNMTFLHEMQVPKYYKEQCIECHNSFFTSQMPRYRVVPEKVILLQLVKQFSVVTQPKHKQFPTYVSVPFRKLLRNPKLVGIDPTPTYLWHLIGCVYLFFKSQCTCVKCHFYQFFICSTRSKIHLIIRALIINDFNIIHDKV